MKTRAAVAWEAGKPLEVMEIDLEGPKEGEVLIRNVATGVCHTDAFTLSGEDPEGIFPSVLGHEGGAVVEEIGPGVSSVSVGDQLIPLYTPECGKCKFCTSGKTNLCQAIRATQGQGLMPDGTSRFSSGGKQVFHYMGTSTFSEYTVLPEIAVAKISPKAPLEKVCLLGCGITTGIGAVLNTAKVEKGSNYFMRQWQEITIKTRPSSVPILFCFAMRSFKSRLACVKKSFQKLKEICPFFLYLSVVVQVKGTNLNLGYCALPVYSL